MKTRTELRLKYGTLEEFEMAVWEAFAQLFITVDEAVLAIQKYREEYNNAIEGEG